MPTILNAAVTRRLGAMPVNVVLALQPPRFTFVVGDLTAPNEGVGLDVVERPTQHRANFIAPG